MPAPHVRVSASAVVVSDGKLLLVKFDDETGPHYNLPGGGADPGESAIDCCIRETREETGARVTVGRLLLVREYEPVRCRNAYGKRHKLNLVFECALMPGSRPVMPPSPDPHQVGVEWVALEDILTINLVSATLPRQILDALDGAPTLYITEQC
jgi:8-oxo-dGTP pyrophosphatase MutT (NUDIX family)